MPDFWQWCPYLRECDDFDEGYDLRGTSAMLYCSRSNCRIERGDSCGHCDESLDEDQLVERTERLYNQLRVFRVDEVRRWREQEIANCKYGFSWFVTDESVRKIEDIDAEAQERISLLSNIAIFIWILGRIVSKMSAYPVSQRYIHERILFIVERSECCATPYRQVRKSNPFRTETDVSLHTLRETVQTCELYAMLFSKILTLSGNSL